MNCDKSLIANFCFRFPPVGETRDRGGLVFFDILMNFKQLLSSRTVALNIFLL